MRCLVDGHGRDHLNARSLSAFGSGPEAAGHIPRRRGRWHCGGEVMFSEVCRSAFSAHEDDRRAADSKLLAAAAPASLSADSICRSLATFHGMGGLPVPLAYSPDGKLVASSAALSPDYQLPAAETGRWPIGLWDVAAGRNRAVLKCDGQLLALAFDASSQTVAAGCTIPDGQKGRLGPRSGRLGEIRSWDTTTGKNTHTVRLTGHATDILCMAFSPDGQTLASGAGWVEKPDVPAVTGEIRLWDVATGRNIDTLESQRGKGCFSNLLAAVRSITFSPDGKTIASGGSTAVELFEVATGREIAAIEVGTPVWAVAYSPDGRTLACGGGHDSTNQRDESMVKLLDVATGKVTATLLGHRRRVLLRRLQP